MRVVYVKLVNKLYSQIVSSPEGLTVTRTERVIERCIAKSPSDFEHSSILARSLSVTGLMLLHNPDQVSPWMVSRTHMTTRELNMPTCTGEYRIMRQLSRQNSRALDKRPSKRPKNVRISQHRVCISCFSCDFQVKIFSLSVCFPCRLYHDELQGDYTVYHYLF